LQCRIEVSALLERLGLHRQRRDVIGVHGQQLVDGRECCGVAFILNQRLDEAELQVKVLRIVAGGIAKGSCCFLVVAGALEALCRALP